MSPRNTESLTRTALELRNRLRQIIATKSQSDVARLTETSVANISRYLKGRRVPAEFVAALVNNMKVNPMWLLVGQGTMFLGEALDSGGQRRRLADFARPLLEQLLIELDQSLADTRRTAELSTAAEHVSRLCDDAALRKRLTETQQRVRKA